MLPKRASVAVATTRCRPQAQQAQLPGQDVGDEAARRVDEPEGRRRAGRHAANARARDIRHRAGVQLHPGRATQASVVVPVRPEDPADDGEDHQWNDDRADDHQGGGLIAARS